MSPVREPEGEAAQNVEQPVQPESHAVHQFAILNTEQKFTRVSDRKWANGRTDPLLSPDGIH